MERDSDFGFRATLTKVRVARLKSRMNSKEALIMSKKTVIVFVVLFALAVPALGSSFAPGVMLPISRERSELRGVAAPQAILTWSGQEAWQWSASMDEFLRDLPVNIGCILRVYPNIDADIQGINGVFASFAELGDTVRLPSPWLIEAQKDLLGRWYIDVPIDEYRGPRCLRFYAWIKDGKREDHSFLWLIHWARKKDASQLVEKMEYTTSPWAGNDPINQVEVARMMRRAGVGGSGLVYDQLLDADSRSQPQPATTTIEPEPVRVADPSAGPIAAVPGVTYEIVVTMNGRPYTSKDLAIVVKDDKHGDRTFNVPNDGRLAFSGATPGQCQLKVLYRGQPVTGEIPYMVAANAEIPVVLAKEGR